MFVLILLVLLVLFFTFKSLKFVSEGFKVNFGLGILLSALFLFTVVVPVYLLIFVYVQPIPFNNPKIYYAVYGSDFKRPVSKQLIAICKNDKLY